MPSPPRPILKMPPSPTLMATSPLPFSSSRIPVFDSPHVHFPPTPTMTQTEITHSSFTYDRKPIVVLPNSCALPGRGERAVDAFPDPECDLELLTLVHRKKKAAKIGYFHPRAYDAVESEAVDGDHPEQQSSSLLFARDSSSYLSSPYRIPNDTLYDARIHFRPIQAIGTLDASDTASDPGNFRLNGPMDACQFIQHVPHMDLSLPFMPPKPTTNKTHQKEYFSSPKNKATTRSRTSGNTNNFERTRKVVSHASCGAYNSGFCDPGLEGCLGGF